MSLTVTTKMVGGGLETASVNMSRVANRMAANAGLETGLPLRFRHAPSLKNTGCLYRDGSRLGTGKGSLLVRRQAALLAAAQDHDDFDIVKVKRLSDGSQLFTFGPSASAPPESTAPTSAQADNPRPRSSGFTKRSTVAKPAKPRAVPAAKPAEEPTPESSRPSRPRSNFARRSPVPHSSSRAPVSTGSGAPVAVSPTVTPARRGRSAPSAGAPLTGVRERSEAPVPTQERVRGKSQFVRRSPVAGGRKLRGAVPSVAEEVSSNERPDRSSRLPSAFSKRSPIVRKSARRLEAVAEKAEPAPAAVSRSHPSRLPSSFKKPSIVGGRPARKLAEVAAARTSEEDGAARAKRPATSFKKASPIISAGRGARKPGPRIVQDLTGIVTNGVAKAAAAVERTVEKLVEDVVGDGSGAWDMEDEEIGASGDSDLHKMKLADLRLLAKERKIKGLWTMKKVELISALEVSFAENV